ncbi:hypothetical protein FALBO_4857 [Fusarium albosuccineum]|uniref:Uncharacterized protein n=1 Tax=Fusarium albosuccineum TaxID=1237068 RepID=A0A8H4LIE9_9HYPO|nr:hypothetical protein FALBO_4857 [Fusarium albosuccineum]
MPSEVLPSLRPDGQVPEDARPDSSDPRWRGQRPLNLRLNSTSSTPSNTRAAYAFLIREHEELKDLLEKVLREVRDLRHDLQHAVPPGVTSPNTDLRSSSSFSPTTPQAMETIVVTPS